MHLEALFNTLLQIQFNIPGDKFPQHEGNTAFEVIIKYFII